MNSSYRDLIELYIAFLIFSIASANTALNTLLHSLDMLILAITLFSDDVRYENIAYTS
jgi:hypothetical protein